MIITEHNRIIAELTRPESKAPFMDTGGRLARLAETGHVIPAECSRSHDKADLAAEPEPGWVEDYKAVREERFP